MIDIKRLNKVICKLWYGDELLLYKKNFVKLNLIKVKQPDYLYLTDTYFLDNATYNIINEHELYIMIESYNIDCFDCIVQDCDLYAELTAIRACYELLQY